jgi:hypothetical protein
MTVGKCASVIEHVARPGFAGRVRGGLRIVDRARNRNIERDRRPNPVICSWEVTRVLGCTAGAAKAGVPPNRTTETQSNLVIVINACSCSFVAATDLIDGRALSATTFAFATDIGAWFANAAKFLFRQSSSTSPYVYLRVVACGVVPEHWAQPDSTMSLDGKSAGINTKRTFSCESLAVPYLRCGRTTKETTMKSTIIPSCSERVIGHDEWISCSHWGMFPVRRKFSR